MTTLQEAISIVLHQIGEEAGVPFASPLSVKAKETIQASLLHIANIKDWEYLKSFQPATSWSTYLATVSNISKLMGVFVGTHTEGFSKVEYLEHTSFYKLPIAAATAVPYTGRIFYTQNSRTEFAFNPYPQDATAQDRVFFRILRSTNKPEAATDIIDIPEEYINILTYKASSLLALNHLKDMDMYGQYLNMFEIEANNIRTRDGKTTGTFARSGRW